MREVTKEDWNYFAEKHYGENFKMKLGDAEYNCIFGEYLMFNSRLNNMEERPLTKRMASNIARSKYADEEPLNMGMIKQAICEYENRPPFGQGLSENEFKVEYLLESIKVAELPGTDGWHDWQPDISAYPELAEECRRAVLEASLKTGGHMIAYDPKTNTGLIAQLASCLHGSEYGNVLTDNEFSLAQHANFLINACSELDLSIDDIFSKLESDSDFTPR